MKDRLVRSLNLDFQTLSTSRTELYTLQRRINENRLSQHFLSRLDAQSGLHRCSETSVAALGSGLRDADRAVGVEVGAAKKVRKGRTEFMCVHRGEQQRLQQQISLFYLQNRKSGGVEWASAAMAVQRQ